MHIPWYSLFQELMKNNPCIAYVRKHVLVLSFANVICCIIPEAKILPQKKEVTGHPGGALLQGHCAFSVEISVSNLLEYCQCLFLCETQYSEQDLNLFTIKRRQRKRGVNTFCVHKEHIELKEKKSSYDLNTSDFQPKMWKYVKMQLSVCVGAQKVHLSVLRYE